MAGELVNAEGLLDKLDKLGEIDLTQALNTACLLVENEAKQNCPVGTGELRNSISHEVEGNEAVVGTNVFYAPYVEYGTGLFAAAGNGRQTPWSYQDAKGEWHTTTGQKPQPFLNPALDANREAIKETIMKNIMEGVG